MSQTKPLREYLNEENMAKRYLAGLALLKEERPKLPEKSVHHLPSGKLGKNQRYIEPSYPLVSKYSLHAFWESMLIPFVASGLLFAVNQQVAIIIVTVSLIVLLLSTVLTYTGRSRQKIRGFLARILLSKNAKQIVEQYKQEHMKYFDEIAEYKKLVSEVREEIQPFLNDMNDRELGFTYINDMGKVVRLDPQMKVQYGHIIGSPVNYI